MKSDPFYIPTLNTAKEQSNRRAYQWCNDEDI